MVINDMYSPQGLETSAIPYLINQPGIVTSVQFLSLELMNTWKVMLCLFTLQNSSFC